MKSLIILKGLAKTEKKKWVKNEKLDSHFLDIDVFRKIYSTPELVKPEVEILNRSCSNLVHQRFMEALIIRLGKGNLVVVDMNEDPVGTVETLAMIFGYTVFYYVQSIPQDYYNNAKKYSLYWQASKKKSDLENDVKNFLNLQLNDKLLINSYSDVLNYWEKEEVVIKLKSKHDILHISDIHSNWSLWSDAISKQKSKIVIHHGDYIDGPVVGGSRKIMNEIIKDSGKNGWYWLEGNHEIRLRKYLGWVMLSSFGSSKTVTDLLYTMIPEEFLNTTAKEFSDLTALDCKKWLQELNKKLNSHIIIIRDSETYICTHAGLRLLEQLSPKYIGSVMYGGRDIDRQDKEFSSRNINTRITSIHAHCKYPNDWSICKYKKVINIDPEDNTEIIILENNINNINYVKNSYQSCSK